MASSLTLPAGPVVASTPKASVGAVSRQEPWIIFGASFLVYAFIGWVAAYVIQTYNWDGVTRIAQAHGVFFSRQPHLSAIGFVWMPLPVLTDLPLVLLLKPLGLVLLAGPVMSALYGALALTQLSELLRRLEVPAFWRWTWVAGFAAHPLIVQNAAMGLSEAPFLAFLLMSINGFARWDRDREPGGLVWAAVGSALALYCRYEALALAGAMTLAIVWRLRLDSVSIWRRTTGGSVLAFITPSIWALILWILVNWDIMHNPIYFLVGPGSTSTTPDTAQAVGPSHPFAFAQGSVEGSLRLLLTQIVDLAPLVLPASALLVICGIWRRRLADFAFLALGWSILGFVFLIALRGLLPPFTRYFFWVVPAGIVIAGAAYRAIAPGWPRHCVAFCTALLLILASVSLSLQSWARLADPFPQRVAGALLLPREALYPEQLRGMLDEFKEVAKYLNNETPETLILSDAAIASPLVFFLDRPNEMVLTTDTDFLPILRDPVGQVDQILVPYPSFDAKGRSDILKQYPDLYDGGKPWAQLVHEFPGPSAWRLYQVQRPDTDDYDDLDDVENYAGRP
ncbi:MAG: hypothetical protein M1370_09975 [Bacteroidetes bacterium]|nr:hypothetical protein [Bacteroidota bacterium]MCL5025011.1 hypothetical protein [Chloroflexota bacterium]